MSVRLFSSVQILRRGSVSDIGWDLAAKQRTTLHLGGEDIIKTLASLPPTRHPLEEASKFVFDAWTQPAILDDGGEALFVSVHGEFAEGKRSNSLFRITPSC
jgi:hypothetical protein